MIFGKKKYTLKFQKACQYVDSMHYREVYDAYLMSTLVELQERYDFQIISVKFRACFSNSYITIKCKKEDKNKIFAEYCMKLNTKIDNFSF